MALRKAKKEQTIDVQKKLTELLTEMASDDPAGSGDGRLVCETECTMARIRSYSDFLYAIRVKPIQTLCCYTAAVLFLLALAAFWCSEWILGAGFVVFFVIFATMPHNLRIFHFNKTADSMEQSYGKIINADFKEDNITLSVCDSSQNGGETNGAQNTEVRKTAVPSDGKGVTRIDIPYDRISRAYECSHSFYLFPVDENNKKTETIICDKTLFLCGTPMQLRDILVRKCKKDFKIKTKKGNL